MNTQQVFATIALTFNNEEVLIPDGKHDLQHIETIDLNDQFQIKIQRDCM